MNEPWKEKLRERFRSVGLDRLRDLARALGEERGERREWILGELHTLKGEAGMLGLLGVSKIAHAAEERLTVASGATDAFASPEVRASILSALDVVAEVLREGFADEARMNASLDAAHERLSTPVNSEPEPLSGPLPEVSRSESAPEVDVEPAIVERDRSGVRWIRIPAAGVEDLCDAVAELTTDFQLLATALRASAPAGRSSLEAQAIREACDRCLVQLEGVGSAAWAMRMVPIEPMLQDLCRHARELAELQGKALRTRVHAARVQVDRDLLDALWDPLVHLIRNAVDHGIEPAYGRAPKPEAATLSFDAEPSGAQIVLSIADDGRGIDPVAVKAAAVQRGLLVPEEDLPDDAALDLIFRPGFSTRALASDVSGRGIGLDVVQRAVEALGGTISVASEVGRGTRFELQIPASATKQRLLVLVCRGDLYAVPARDVIEVRKLGRGFDVSAEGPSSGPYMMWKEERIPLRSLSAALGALGAEGGEEEPWILILRTGGGGGVALSVPHVLGERELIRRPADALVAATGIFVGSAMLEDGRLVLVASTPGLLRRGGRLPVGRMRIPS